MILFNCEHATARMTDHLERALPWPQRLAFRAHLLLCAGCRAFLKGLRAVPDLAREAFQEPEAPPAVGCATLDSVLAKIRSGAATAGPSFHPDAAQWARLESGQADLPTRVMLELHLGACPACRAAHPGFAFLDPADTQGAEPPLPAALLAQLRPATSWVWMRRFLNGSRAAKVWEEGGTALWLTFVAPGSAFPRHRHCGAETSVLLAGWVREGLELAGPGDFIHREPGSEHAPEANGTDGCWVLSRIESAGIRFKGWRRLLA